MHRGILPKVFAKFHNATFRSCGVLYMNRRNYCNLGDSPKSRFAKVRKMKRSSLSNISTNFHYSPVEIKKNSFLKLSNIAYFIKIRGFPEGGVGGGCKILHGSTLTNISAKFHNDTFCSFGVLFMDRRIERSQ